MRLFWQKPCQTIHDPYVIQLLMGNISGNIAKYYKKEIIRENYRVILIE
jgi:hypothetical protein